MSVLLSGGIILPWHQWRSSASFTDGAVKAAEVTIETEDGSTEQFWPDCGKDEMAWAVVQWARYEDGHEEEGSFQYLRSPATEKDAQRALQKIKAFYSMTKEYLLDLPLCLEATEEDYGFIESRFPNYQSPPADPAAIYEYDVYQARLKVLAGLQPKTVEKIRLADETKDPQKRDKIQREAVQAYFAELAHHWTEDGVLAWQRSNPVGTEWLCEFGRVFAEPEREIDPVNHELAFNWLRRKY